MYHGGMVRYDKSGGESLTDRAYGALKQMITTLELPPGGLVNEEGLQERLGIGRTPIREALQRLEREQLVSVLPRRGIFVTAVDPADLPMLCESRAMIEAYAARLAALRGSEADWDEMDALLASVGDVSEAGELMSVDRRCHEVVWAASGNPFLTGTLDMLYTQSDRLWHLYLSDIEFVHDAIAEHRTIADALRHGDDELVGTLSEQHVRHFEQAVRAAIGRRLESPLAG